MCNSFATLRKCILKTDLTNINWIQKSFIDIKFHTNGNHNLTLYPFSRSFPLLGVPLHGHRNEASQNNSRSIIWISIEWKHKGLLTKVLVAKVFRFRLSQFTSRLDNVRPLIRLPHVKGIKGILWQIVLISLLLLLMFLIISNLDLFVYVPDIADGVSAHDFGTHAESLADNHLKDPLSQGLQ